MHGKRKGERQREKDKWKKIGRQCHREVCGECERGANNMTEIEVVHQVSMYVLYNTYVHTYIHVTSP